MSTTRPMLTQREAATACGVSRTTIRRRREANDLPGAVQDPQRGWLIPIDDLLAAGFRLHAPAGPDASTAPAGTTELHHDHDQDVAALRAELARVRHEHTLELAAALRAELARVRHEHTLELAAAQHGQALAEATVGHLEARLRERGAHIEDL
ncbi:MULTISPECIES: helix-turn-helix domain-containing protein [unclassified Streptomyces]|uniref:helix-turn-helix transcriptional regulator n=1 Tax=unclassified Streptomyces TaxID=2593676 RepID=UPI00339149C4